MAGAFIQALRFSESEIKDQGTVVQMEDFALLAGTGALFALLAAVMFAPRRIDDSESFVSTPMEAGTR